MSRLLRFILIGSIPLALVAVAWQAGRYASVEAAARRLETEQQGWAEANSKLSGGIAVLRNRERIAELAKRLGLDRATAERRVFIELEGSPGGAGEGSAQSPATRSPAAAPPSAAGSQQAPGAGQ